MSQVNFDKQAVKKGTKWLAAGDRAKAVGNRAKSFANGARVAVEDEDNTERPSGAESRLPCRARRPLGGSGAPGRSPNTAANPRLLAALRYARRDWAVLPCRPRDKQPATKHGFKDATTDKGTIVRAWTITEHANVGIATGAVSGIVVLDIDPRNGGDASLAELERVNGPLPETLSVATGGGGRHFYFSAPVGEIRSGVLADGIDVKADGGYVIAPPSMHPNGGEYLWLNDPGKTELAPCPGWIRPPSKKERAKAAGIDAALDAGITPLGRAFAAQGMLGRSLDGGKRSVVCPWQDKHTTGKLQDASTVIFPANAPNGIGGFHCSHSLVHPAALRRSCTSLSAGRLLGRRSELGWRSYD